MTPAALLTDYTVNSVVDFTAADLEDADFTGLNNTLMFRSTGAELTAARALGYAAGVSNAIVATWDTSLVNPTTNPLGLVDAALLAVTDPSTQSPAMARWLVLDGIILAGANLAKARILGASIKNASFAAAAMSYGDFRGCNFQNTALAGASLICAKLDRCDLRTSIIVATDFVGSAWQKTSLRRCRLEGVDFSGAADITDVSFEGAIRASDDATITGWTAVEIADYPGAPVAWRVIPPRGTFSARQHTLDQCRMGPWARWESRTEDGYLTTAGLRMLISTASYEAWEAVA